MDADINIQEHQESSAPTTPYQNFLKEFPGMGFKKYVGDLGADWQFPSDHLPVGARVAGLKVISWNVLNRAYMDWVTVKNSQGLNGSMISQEDVPVREVESLTKREARIAESVVYMSQSADVIALQEVGPVFLKTLQEALPDDRGLLLSGDRNADNQEVLIYNKAKLKLKGAYAAPSVYAAPSEKLRPLQEVKFLYQGQTLHIFNAHVPGDPQGSGPEDLAKWVKSRTHKGDVIIALGDFNFEADRVCPLFPDWQHIFPYPTNVGLDRVSKAIDPILIHGTTGNPLPANEVLPDLQKVVDQLQ